MVAGTRTVDGVIKSTNLNESKNYLGSDPKFRRNGLGPEKKTRSKR
jgi:hypothetical protein